MKILSYLLVLPLLLLFISCSNSGSYISENDISESKPLSGVTRLALDGVFSLSLAQSDEESIRLEGPSELIDKLIIDQQGDLLVLEMEGNNSGFNFKKGDLKISLSLKKLQELRYDGVGNVKTSGTFTVDTLRINGNGVGNLDLELDAKQLNADFDMVGNINLKGSASRAYFSNNGVGNLDASQLRVQNLDITSSGIGNVDVFCVGNLSMDVSGIGKVGYTGSPTIIKKEVSGIGKVEEN
jgi:hypothetical protein